MTVFGHRGCQGLAQSNEIRADFDPRAVARSQQLLLHGRYRHDPLPRVLEMQPRCLGLHRPRFERKDAGDDLQAVADAMLYLLEQRFLLLQQIAYLPLGVAAVGDVFDGQENELAGVFLKK